MKQKKNKVIFFGDSITEQGMNSGGYINRIESLCKAENKSEEYDFVGAGVGGDKVYDLYLRLEDDVLSKDPAIVLIFIGVNDVWHKTIRQTGTDPEKFKKFYQAIINKIKEKGSKIILCTPATIGERIDLSNDQDADMNEYSDIVRGLAKSNQLFLLDLRKIFLDHNKTNNPGNNESGILTIDGVHLNARGNELVAEEMWKAIKLL